MKISRSTFPARTLSCLAMLLLTVSLAPAQPAPVEGDWLGTLTIPGGSLRIVFHISGTADGSLKATMDSPDQGANGLPVDKVTLTGRDIRLVSSMVRGEYAGRLQSGDSTFDGTWTQSGMSFPLPLARVYKEVTINRPQDPKPPYPYVTEEITFHNADDGVTLAGTLTIPRGQGPFPAVALVSGSGPQDRDETVFSHKPFKVIADHLTRNGIAVLRYDDRGVGKSTGDFSTATSVEFSRDAEAAVRFLRARSDVSGSHVGLIGHSEGGLVAPMVAARSQEVAFVVLLAGPSITGAEIILLQDSLISSANGVSGADIARSLKTNRKIFDLLIAEHDTSNLRQSLTGILQAAAVERPDSTVSEEVVRAGIERSVSQLISPWFRFFLAYDPLPALRSVDCPVLALNGEKDLQVPSAVNLQGISRALRDGGNTRSTVKELPGLNHLFQTAATGSPSEYAAIEETFAPAALSVITEWIKSVTNTE